MKRITRWSLFIVLTITLFAIPSRAFAFSQERELGDKFIFGGEYTMKKGDEIAGNLFIFGAKVALENGSTVTRDVVLFGGKLTTNAKIGRDILVFGGKVTMLNHSDIAGDAILFGSRLTQTKGSYIGGESLSESSLSTINSLPSRLATKVPAIGGIGSWEAWNWLWFSFQLILWALFGFLCALFFISSLERTSVTIFSEPILSWGVGILTLIVSPILLIILVITIILIPISLVGVLVLVTACVLGWTSIGYEVGRNMNRQFNQNWTPVVATSIGTFALSLLTFGTSRVIPCVGWLIPFAIVIPIGLGAVLLTRFGTQAYPPRTSSASQN